MPKAKKQKDPIGVWYMIKKIYPLCFKIKPLAYLIYTRSCVVINRLLLAATIVATQIFFDAVYSVSLGESTLYSAIFALILFTSSRLAGDIMYAMNFFTGEVHLARIWGHITSEINKKSGCISGFLPLSA
ncbi:MAG: hypothetical protein FWH48_03935 [Oscillospiraceae bacterium]|nr:hypothetical protein [Oscillospiraceae bacterium]